MKRTRRQPIVNPLPDYAIEPMGEGRFKVLRPASRGGGFYVIDAANETCNCASFAHGEGVPCKHIEHLLTLITSGASHLNDAGRVSEAGELLKAWAEAFLMRAERLESKRRAA